MKVTILAATDGGHVRANDAVDGLHLRRKAHAALAKAKAAPSADDDENIAAIAALTKLLTT